MLTKLPAEVCALFLDMNGTFIFGHDRFGDDQDFSLTYRHLDGEGLDDAAVDSAVRKVVARLDELYADRRFDNRFPKVAEVVRATLRGIGDADAMRIETIIALHEFGELAHAEETALRALRDRFDKLVVVSNLWSDPERWRDYLAMRLGPSFFDALVFSSEVGINKPAEAIYRHGLTLADVEPEQAVMIGDDYQRDVCASRGLGMHAIWVDREASQAIDEPWTVARIGDLV